MSRETAWAWIGFGLVVFWSAALLAVLKVAGVIR